MTDTRSPSNSSSSVPLSDSFQFDGSTSDLAQQFYRRHVAGATADRLGIAPPSAVASQLSTLGLSFDDLPGLLQRALIWDAGFVFTSRGDLVAVKTLDGRSMDSIAVTLQAYTAQGCKTQECVDTDQGVKWYKNGECNGAQMSGAALCAIDMLPSDEDAKMSMWSTGGDPKSIPQLIAYHHHWTDSGSGKSYAMHVIHTRSKANSPRYGECTLTLGSGTNSGVGSIVIPCAPTKALNASSADRLETPKPGKIASAWLNDFKKSQSPVTSVVSTASVSPSNNPQQHEWRIASCVGNERQVERQLHTADHHLGRGCSGSRRAAHRHLRAAKAATQCDGRQWRP
ncbi:hypothetical protein PINS_up017641 [Pythium insidiosum]|nr:hypothetical protein PINS_up017641 [Pythium insidiosum]